MTDKQITTLILFAQNYSLQTIAKKQRVSLATIRERIKSLSRNHAKEFNNAVALREVYKRNKRALNHPQNLGSCYVDIEQNSDVQLL